MLAAFTIVICLLPQTGSSFRAGSASYHYIHSLQSRAQPKAETSNCLLSERTSPAGAQVCLRTCDVPALCWVFHVLSHHPRRPYGCTYFPDKVYNVYWLNLPQVLLPNLHVSENVFRFYLTKRERQEQRRASQSWLMAGLGATAGP